MSDSVDQEPDIHIAYLLRRTRAIVPMQPVIGYETYDLANFSSVKMRLKSLSTSSSSVACGNNT